MTQVEHDTYDEDSIFTLVAETFKKEQYENHNIELTGVSEKGEGYVADITFMKVTAIKPGQKSKDYHLVLKCSKQRQNVREKFPVRLAFERESFLYSHVVPLYKKFEKEHDVNIVKTILPKCYKIYLNEKQEAIILQNLKVLGYELHSRIEPLDKKHLKVSLDSYGKWHALSMTFRHQNPDKFNGLFQNLEIVLEAFLSLSFANVMESNEKDLHVILEENNEKYLSEQIQKLFPNGFVQTFKELLHTTERNSVFLHGDSWNNNVMFKYNDIGKTQPESAMFLDFQISQLGPPVFDVSFHIYSAASEKELEQLDDLLLVYYSSLASTISTLGSDPEKVFSYNELKGQWKKYSLYGVIFALTIMPICFLENEDIPDLQEINSENISSAFGNAKKNKNFSSRIIAVVRHFLSHMEK